jgi:hypothetical protein
MLTLKGLHAQPGFMEAHTGAVEVYLGAVVPHPGALEAVPWSIEAHTRNFAKLKLFSYKFRLSRNSKSHFRKHPTWHSVYFVASSVHRGW